MKKQFKVLKILLRAWRDTYGQMVDDTAGEFRLGIPFLILGAGVVWIILLIGILICFPFVKYSWATK